MEKDKWEVLVEEEVLRRDYILHSYLSYPVISSTRLDLENPATGHRWDTTTVCSFLKGHSGLEDGYLKVKEARTESESYHIEAFRKLGSYPEGTLFKKNTELLDHRGTLNYWDIICPVCSKDEYVKAGICSGIFQAKTDNIKSGKLSCRCSRGYRWSQQEREYLIKRLCNEEGHQFINWVGDYKTSNTSKFAWLCNKGHYMESFAQVFVRGGRCTECQGGGGFNKNLKGVLYITEWACDKYKIVKFGITNNGLYKRHKQIMDTAPWLTHKILYTFHHEDGGLVASVESYFKKKYKPHLSVPKKILPDGYTEAFFYDEEILSEIVDYCSENLHTDEWVNNIIS